MKRWIEENYLVTTWCLSVIEVLMVGYIAFRASR